MKAFPSPTQVEVRIPSRLGLERVPMVTATHLARRMGFSEERADNLALAVSEACTNAIEHGNKLQEDLPVTVILTMEPARLEVKVIDQGPGMEPGVLSPPDIAKKIRGEEPPGGMGLFLIRKLVDEFEFVSRSAEGSYMRLVIFLDRDSRGVPVDGKASGSRR